MRTVLALLIFAGALIYCVQPPPPNALQIRYQGQTRLVRHPQPSQFSEGQLIRYRTETGEFIEATVLGPVSVNYPLTDDTLSAKEQIANIQHEGPVYATRNEQQRSRTVGLH
ncbi:hypothetical protein [Spirosoma agri]|uniref:Uncharacterized protein n=1 Tax=Spirosoma agri TaxID=1987381 RepID=A0A6M0IMJ6_9BACT|nr:hypothetical protein [Spirosoma agri]NEU69550.1 hypothetical protein [Spirosoma agri]